MGPYSCRGCRGRGRGKEAPKAFRHALRVSELVGLAVEQFDLKAATVHIRRAKNGTPGIHGLQGDELRLIRQLIRENGQYSGFLFLSERKAPLSIDGAQKLIKRLGEAARLPLPIHAHMLRHSAGYALRDAASIPGRCKPSWGTSRLPTP
jgi:integrase